MTDDANAKLYVTKPLIRWKEMYEHILYSEIRKKFLTAHGVRKRIFLTVCNRRESY